MASTAGHATTPHITDNIIRYNAWGILFEFTDHGQINLNHIMNNSQYGIVIDTSPVNRIYSNNISGNGVGIIPVRCLQNEIYQNNFMNNQKNQATWKNSYSKWHDNYWSDLSQHLIKTTYLIFGALVYEATGQKLPWIQLDSTPHQTPWVI